jgi:putative hydrolase of the HAD superfamily
MTISTVFFDLDDTLYPASTGVWQQIKTRISQYLIERVGIPAHEADARREQYHTQFGTTLRGLQTEFDVDMEEYLAYVHDVPLREHIQPNPHLLTALETLPARKFIFTNADSAHARRVLNILNATHHFEGIIDIVSLAPHCKPMPESFALALKMAGNPAPETCALIDDLPRTVRAAREHGMRAILFGANAPSPEAHATLNDWRDLHRALFD